MMMIKKIKHKKLIRSKKNVFLVYHLTENVLTNYSKDLKGFNPKNVTNF